MCSSSMLDLPRKPLGKDNISWRRSPGGCATVTTGASFRDNGADAHPHAPHARTPDARPVTEQAEDAECRRRGRRTRLAPYLNSRRPVADTDRCRDDPQTPDGPPTEAGETQGATVAGDRAVPAAARRPPVPRSHRGRSSQSRLGRGNHGQPRWRRVGPSPRCRVPIMPCKPGEARQAGLAYPNEDCVHRRPDLLRR